MSRIPRILLILLLAGSILGAGWVLNHSQNNDLKKAALADERLPPYVISLGFVDACSGVAKLYPLQSGRVEAAVAEGKFVDKGDVLLKLDNRQAGFLRRQADANLKAASELLQQAQQGPERHLKEIAAQEAAIKAAKAQRAATDFEYKAKKDFYQDKELGKNVLASFEEGLKRLDALIETEQIKLAALKLHNPQVDIHRAQADVDAKQARLEEAKLAEQECTMLAPDAGTVLRVNVRVGEVLGANPSGPAIQFALGRDKVVRAEIMQEWARGIHVGQAVTIEDDTRHEKGELWKGKVKEIAKWIGPKRQIVLEPFMVNDVRTLECLIEVISEGPHPLVIGQRVRVTIDTSKK